MNILNKKKKQPIFTLKQLPPTDVWIFFCLKSGGFIKSKLMGKSQLPRLSYLMSKMYEKLTEQISGTTLKEAS